MPTAYLNHGTPIGDNLAPIGDPVLNESARGWDSLRESVLMQSTPLQIISHLEQRLPRGGVHENHANMFLTGRLPRYQGGGLYRVDLTYQGIVLDRGYRREVRAYGETSNGEKIAISAGLQAQGYPAIAEKLKIEQPLLAVTTSYISLTTPSYTEVKKPIGTLPAGFPALPTPPTQLWSFIAEPTYVYPSGWVLDDRDARQLPWTEAHLVTDRHLFRFQTEM